jgi:hypothetical protein
MPGRRRWARSIRQHHDLRQVARTCLFFAATLSSAAIVLGMRHPRLLPQIMSVSCGWVGLAASCIGATLEQASQADDTYPRRTWRDYAGDRDFADYFRFQPAEIEELQQTMYS